MSRSQIIIVLFLPGLMLLTETFGQSMPRQRAQSQQRLLLLNSQSSTVRFDISYKLTAPGTVSRIQFLVLLPQTISDRQKIISIESTPEPERTFQKNGNTYAEYIFTSPDSKIIYIDISIEARLYRYDLSTAMSNPQPANLEEAELAEFLKQEMYLEKNNPAIQKIAQDIIGETDIDIVKSIYDYVLDNMEYVKFSGKGYGAATVLRYHKGDCTEYSDLFVALCRAKGIPARVISGYTMGINSIPTGHNWAEVYLKDYGWVPFELSGADVPSVNIRNVIFGHLMPNYLYFSYVRSDKVLNYFGTCLLRCWGGPARLTSTVRCTRLAWAESK